MYYLLNKLNIRDVIDCIENPTANIAMNFQSVAKTVLMANP